MAQIDVNSITVIGRVTADGKYREYGENGKELKFSVANNRGYGDFAKVNFFECRIHGKRAFSLQQYITKGIPVGISGELSQDRWETSEGQKRNSVYIECSEIQLMGSGKQNSQNESNNFTPKQEEPPKFSSGEAGPDGFSPDKDFEDDIPF